MSCILHLETSTKVCSVALSVDGQVLFSKENRQESSHASSLGVFVMEAVSYAREQNLKPEAVAISSGPGSYTGLRIGVSEAKGLCYGWNIPLIAIPTLKIMTSSVIRSGHIADFYCPMIDARRMEVYSAVYNKKLELLQDTSAVIVDEMAYRDFTEKGSVLFFGDGSDKSKGIIRSSQALSLKGVDPVASFMVPLAEKAFVNQSFVDVAYFEPFYLKEFMATTPKNKILGVNHK